MPTPRVIFLAVVVAVTMPLSPALARLALFSGEYSLADIEPQGDEVSLTIALRVINGSEAVALGARITLDVSDAPEERERPNNDSTLASFEAHNLRPGHAVQFERRIQVPSIEYLRWREGYPPTVSIWFYDEAGAFNRQTVRAREVAVLLPGVQR